MKLPTRTRPGRLRWRGAQRIFHLRMPTAREKKIFKLSGVAISRTPPLFHQPKMIMARKVVWAVPDVRVGSRTAHLAARRQWLEAKAHGVPACLAGCRLEP